MRKRCRSTLILAMGVFASLAIAQDGPRPNASADLSSYDLNRETHLIGTVQSYSPTGQTASFGAHVILLTSTGELDVHLGSAKLLFANHFAIQNGDALRIMGENVAYASGTQFVARIVQKGTQVLALRSIRGIPLFYAAPRDGATLHGGVL